MTVLKVYQYVGPMILFPASYYLWLRRVDYDHQLVLFMMSMPILYAYIIPAIGTNWLKLWEFKTRWRLGRFRPHNGFVFGSAISLFALFLVEPRPVSLGAMELVRTGFLTGSTMAFWIWIYDIYAVKSGFLVVYNRPHFYNRGAEAVATEYAPVFFCAFGICYGLAIHIGEYYLLEQGRSSLYVPLFIAFNAVLLTVPGLAYVVSSLVRNGDMGLRPFQGDTVLNRSV